MVMELTEFIVSQSRREISGADNPFSEPSDAWVAFADLDAGWTDLPRSAVSWQPESAPTAATQTTTTATTLRLNATTATFPQPASPHTRPSADAPVPN
ncbi:hypothetical protein ABZ721_35855 [Streptomyces sp. NPDC006733]|uniref:hypothetical protein n=1 Tax=Streptomyces sp. NPDC006733 TaxID=3155460 RepID=UPI0033E2BEFD